MSATYYGKGFARNTAPVRIMEHPKVEPLPGPDDKQPRRRRTFTCPHLRINDEHPGLFPHVGPASFGHQITGGFCVLRNADISGSYIVDVCACSIAKTCPWVEEREAA
jgi:hypothetical protein